MKRVLLMVASVLLAINVVAAQALPNLPKTLHSGAWKAGHVQGIAVDSKQEFVYLSFTTTSPFIFIFTSIVVNER